jgi:plastocyanin
MKRLPTRLVAFAALGAGAAVGGQAVAAPSPGRSVTLRDVAFSPASLSVSRGTTVTFRWRDDNIEHNVISKGTKRFPSIAARETGSRSRTFTKAGTYRYVCTLHPGMSGRITVR